MRHQAWICGGLLLAAADTALAACGSSFCTVNTNWNVQNLRFESGFFADLRFEYIDQDQLRAGSGKVSAGETPEDPEEHGEHDEDDEHDEDHEHEEHEEIRTINRNLIATLDYGSSSGWGVTAVLPFVGRDHSHLDTDEGVVQTWDFREIGDLRVVGRYQFLTTPKGYPLVVGFNLGLKLPTGRFDIANSNGEKAERSLQPGTGTTDGIVGAYLTGAVGPAATWFTQVAWQGPFDNQDDYEPGQRFAFDVGASYNVNPRIALLAQFNYLYREHDHGANAEPENSGGQYLYFSPGISFAITRNFQIYGFVQLPLYQYVNGVQLTADWAASAGITVRF